MGKNSYLVPLDLELRNLNQTRTEQIWLTKEQFEVLEIVARVLGQTISEYLTGTILSMMECDIDETVPNKLKERFSREAVVWVNQG